MLIGQCELLAGDLLSDFRQRVVRGLGLPGQKSFTGPSSEVPFDSVEVNYLCGSIRVPKLGKTIREVFHHLASVPSRWL